MSEWGGTAAVHWGEQHLACVVLEDRARIEHQHRVRAITIGTGAQECLESLLCEPKEHFAVEQPIPLSGREAVTEASAKVGVAHRDLIPNDGSTVLRMVDDDGSRSVRRL